jgi:phenylalanyl-tRNA synthetase beta chain
MRVTKDWLSQWIDLPENTAALMCEYSIETTLMHHALSIDPNVRVGKVLKVTEHPNATKLKVTSVDVGLKQPLSIVCGCPTVCEGMVVPVACEGARLPAGVIKNSMLRQVQSEGMLCSLCDLGLEKQSSGLYALPHTATVGQKFADYLGVSPELFDFELTPNRGDCFSVLGIARELHAITGHPIRFPQYKQYPVQRTDHQHACLVFGQVRIINIQPKALPLWMTLRLAAAGIASHHPVVDIINYVMLEIGQPMHAYDAARINGALKVHLLNDDASFLGLNGQRYGLKSNDLVVSDDSGIQALAGVMGADFSKVDHSTTAVILESAHFDMSNVRSASSRLHLHTDASIRFSRFVDPSLPQIALQYAVSLMVEYLSADIDGAIKINDFNYEPIAVSMSHEHLNDVLGTSLSLFEVQGILKRLEIHPIADEHYLIPSHRSADLRHDHDLIEEVIRLYGFNRLPQLPLELKVQAEVPHLLNMREQVTNKLIALGYHEVVTYAFTSLEQIQLFDADLDALVQLANPISTELEYMRQSLLPSILKVASEHFRVGQPDIKLMEIGKRYFNNQEILSLGMCQVFDHADVQKGFAEFSKQFSQVIKNNIAFMQAQLTGFHPGVCAKLIDDSKCLGHIGQLHPKLAQKMFDGKMVMLCQMDLVDVPSVQQYKAFSRFPKIKRDVAYLSKVDLPFDQIREIIMKMNVKYLHNFQVFDIYLLKESSQLSIGIRFVFSSIESNITDEQVQRQLFKINQRLNEVLGITVR